MMPTEVVRERTYLSRRDQRRLEMSRLDPSRNYSFVRRLTSGALWIVCLGINRIFQERRSDETLVFSTKMQFLGFFCFASNFL